MKRCYIEYGCILIVAYFFITIFSYTTSPLYHVWGNTPDSPIFQIIGKYWSRGVLPYKDLWDLKGPYIFFVNALGYSMTGTKIGIYILQIIFLFLTLITIYKIFLLYLNHSLSLFFTLLSLAGLSYIYEGGNLTEEYILFPLTLSFYYIIQWIDKYEKDNNPYHNELHTVIYGIVFGLCLMSRLTNALALCAAVGVIAIVLLWRKEYKNLLMNILYFLIGFIISASPFFLYFYLHDAFFDMWNGTFLFPLEYVTNSSMDILHIGIHYFILSYLNCILLIYVVVLMIRKNKIINVRIVLYMMSAIIPFIWFCYGNGFGHYGMIVYPLFALIILELKKMKSTYLFYVISLIVIVGAASKIRFMYDMYHWDNKEVRDCHDFLKNENVIDYSSFVAYNCDPNLYLAEDIQPAVPVFSLQEMGGERISRWNKFLLSLFIKKQPKWVLVKRPDSNNMIIQPILDKNYIIQKNDIKKQLELYRKK